MSRSVLVVDDEADFITTYRRLLSRHGFRVVTAATRQEALAAMSVEPFALVVADQRLPDGDGLDVVRAARRLPTPSAVIVITGYASEASRRDALAAGAAAYLGKPFSISEFTAVVERTVSPR